MPEGTYKISIYRSKYLFIIWPNITAALPCYRITDVAAIHYNSLSAAISKNFKVYMWGQCKGKCGNDVVRRV